MALQQTPLNAAHRALGGRMVDFGGWDMPVQYPTGTIEEHLRTRTRAALFDVSHMGEFLVRGADAIPFVNRLCANDVTKLVDGQAHYTALLTPQGTVVDDLLVYRFGPEHLLLVVNAGTTEKDWAWFNEHKRVDEAVTLENLSAEYCQIAVQGPEATALVQTLTATPLDEIKYYHFREGAVDGVPALISRTGYTGEDGFELYADAAHAVRLWDKLLDCGNYGTPEGVTPAGLAARNTLRLEAAMALYGHELGEDITPLEANLAWICKLKKGAFTGREALLQQKAAGLQRKLVGFEMTERGIARDGQEIVVDGERVGYVTSGSPAPFLQKNIGLAFVPTAYSQTGQALQIDVRGRLIGAIVVPTPFYKRA